MHTAHCTFFNPARLIFWHISIKHFLGAVPIFFLFPLHFIQWLREQSWVRKRTSKILIHITNTYQCTQCPNAALVGLILFINFLIWYIFKNQVYYGLFFLLFNQILINRSFLKNHFYINSNSKYQSLNFKTKKALYRSSTLNPQLSSFLFFKFEVWKNHCRIHILILTQ